MSNIRSINAAIKAYFKSHPEEKIISAKKLMPFLIEKGVYAKDVKNGLPIRNELKALDADGKLDKLRSVHAVRKDKHIFWYFIPEGSTPPPLEVDKMPAKSDTKRAVTKRAHDDEIYVIDLCDEILRLTAMRQHTFDYLRGDLHRNGRTRSLIPCHGYYPSHRLVIEYLAPDKPKDQYTEEEHRSASGLTRSEQRGVYRERKREVLGKHNVHYLEIPSSEFKIEGQGTIKRDKKKDLRSLSDLLVGFRTVE